MTNEVEDSAFYLEHVSISVDSGDEYEYEEVPVDDDVSVLTGELTEDLDRAVNVIEEAKHDTHIAVQFHKEVTASLVQRPEVVDDFVRNFLLKMGMKKTLNCFQTEWYEMQQKGLLPDEDIGVVPDVYSKNQILTEELKRIRDEAERFRMAAKKAKETYLKLQKERDFHRIHHKRIVQEKNKLITDLKRLKKHYNSYEPTLRQMKHKYELAMKEKMLTKLERDRAVGQVTGLQATLRNLETGKDEKIPPLSGYRAERNLLGDGPTQSALREIRMQTASSNEQGDKVGPVSASTEERQKDDKRSYDSVYPPDNRVNPYLNQISGPPVHLSRTGGLRKTGKLKAHDLAVSNLALHPRKQIIVTASDDHLWKMWAIPNGDIIMTGEGHTDWISDCDFHPSGAQLATSSGDTSVKIWDFAKASCVLTFSEHIHAVWGVSWHCCGDFLASCSMDYTSKIWDINSERCRTTLRGHSDSVNSIQFLHFANTLLTSSADKTLSLWDARTGLCAQTFYGHMHSVNHAFFNLKGDTVASCDSYGTVKFWDVRNGASIMTADVGPHPANRVAFDPSGQLLAVASNDSSVKLIDIATGQVSSLTDHDDAVQAVSFDMTGQYLLSAASDGAVCIWA